MTSPVNRAVADWVMSCDPRFVRHTGTGVVLADGDWEVEMTVEDYLSTYEVGTDEVFFATCDLAISSVAGRELVTAGEMTDVLLDLRQTFATYKEQHRTVTRRLADIAFGDR